MSLTDDLTAILLRAREAGEDSDALRALSALPSVAPVLRRVEAVANVQLLRGRCMNMTTVDACALVGRKHGLPAETVRSWVRLVENATSAHRPPDPEPYSDEQEEG